MVFSRKLTFAGDLKNEWEVRTGKWVWNGVRWASRVLGCVVRNLQAENGRCDSSGV